MRLVIFTCWALAWLVHLVALNQAMHLTINYCASYWCSRMRGNLSPLMTPRQLLSLTSDRFSSKLNLNTCLLRKTCHPRESGDLPRRAQSKFPRKRNLMQVTIHWDSRIRGNLARSDQGYPRFRGDDVFFSRDDVHLFGMSRNAQHGFF